ncbi:MAG: MFS transporter [Armatimonadetes bacterium]|nr:MFS transporter [Armatimonadota bacterium]
MPPDASSHPQPAQREQIATRIAFLVAGLLVAAWAPMIPLVKARLGLDEAQLGSLLLFVGIGSVSTMPFSGGLAGHFGCRKVIIAAATVAAVALPTAATASSSWVLGAALFAFGAGIGTLDVVMNIQAVMVERASGRAMMSGFHGLFSIAGIFGAGLVTGLLYLAWGAGPSAITISVITTLLIFGFQRGLLPYGNEEPSTGFAFPKGMVLLLGTLCFILFMAEGSVLDWGGVLLHEAHKVPKDTAGVGYIAFSITMTVGRLAGDKIVLWLGRFRVLLFGGLLASAGYLIASWSPHWIGSVAGFALVGAGASNTVPVLFTAAGNQKDMPTNLAVAAFTTMGYAGFIVGPAAIGYVAKAASLSLSLTGLALLLIGVAACARRVTRD